MKKKGRERSEESNFPNDERPPRKSVCAEEEKKSGKGKGRERFKQKNKKIN